MERVELKEAIQLIRAGELGEAETLLLKLLESEPKITNSLKLRVYHHLIRIAAETRNFTRIPAFIEEIKSIPVKTEEEKLHFAYCLHATGTGWYYSGNTDKARKTLEQSLELAREVKNEKLVFIVEFTLIEILRKEGRYEEAVQKIASLQGMAEASGDPVDAGWVQIALGNIYRKQGDYKNAIEYLEKALPIFANNKNSNEYHNILWSLGTCYAALEDKEKAKIYLDLAKNSSSGAEFWRINIMSRLTLAELCTILGDFEQAEKLYQEVQEAVGTNENSYFGRRLIRGQTLLAIREGKFEEANNLIDRLVIVAVRENNQNELMRLRLLKAEVLLRNGEPSQQEEARAMLQEALVFFSTRGVRRHQAAALELLGRLDSSSGYPQDALKKITEMLTIAEDGAHERQWVRGMLAKFVLERKLGMNVAEQKIEEVRQVIRRLNSQPEAVVLGRFTAQSYDEWTKDLQRLDAHAQRYVNEFFEDFHFVPQQTVDIEIDRNSHYVREKHMGEIPFHNKFTLMRLLCLLAETPGKEFSKEQLAKEIWGQEYNPLRHDNNIYININRLRKLLEPNPRESRYVMNGSRGYYFNPAMKVNISSKIADTKPRNATKTL